MSLSPRTVTVGLFLGLLLVGALILDDYGISWDEAIQRRHGRVSIDYAAEKLGIQQPKLEPDYDLEDYQWSNYGMVYQITASLLEFQLGVTNNAFAYYRLRHCINFLLYLFALGCFYRTLLLRWPDRVWYPLLGTLVLVLSPRIFGHAFFNPKDHILLVFYVIATYTLLRYLSKRTTGALLWHMVATALVLNTRLPALLLVGATVAVLLWEQLQRPGDFRRLWIAPLYVVGSFGLMIPLFPYLWEDTLTRLYGAFVEMSDFDWGGSNLLFGDVLEAVNVPAYYIPAWIAITTPVVYVLLMLTGIGIVAGRSLSGLRRGKLWKDYVGEADFVQLGLTIGPIIVVIVLNSTLYNGWRHLHFVYPGLVYLLLVGYHRASKNIPRVMAIALGGTMLLTTVNMVRYHPHQYVYFNALIQGEPLLARFDMDYWGVGFREAFTELATQIPDGEVRHIKCQAWPCKDNILALPPAIKNKIVIEDDWARADYVATNFLYPTERGDLKNRSDVFARPVVEIAPAGHLSIGIYSLKDD